MARQNLIVRGGADFSGIKREMMRTQKQLQDFKNSVSGMIKGIGAALGAISFVKFAKDSINMAKDVESSFGQINRLMGSNSSAFKSWVETQAKSYNMSKAEAYKYGAVFSNLISTFSKSTSQTTKYTEDLLKAAAIVSSKTGRSMDDTLNRIRSGLLGETEAIEDLGINVNVAMLQSTEAFKRFANGRSWNQLDFQTQQLIRYFAILEQVNNKFGDSVANNTATRLAQFNATLSNIKLNIGKAFIPILNAVLPPLTAFAAKIEAITAKIALFFQALFGKNMTKHAKANAQATKQQTITISNLGGAMGGAAKATEKAAKATDKLAKSKKKAFHSLAGFDEINNIKTTTDAASSGSGSSGSGGGGGGGAGTSVSMPPIDTSGFDDSVGKIPKRIQEMANKVRAIFSNLSAFIKKHKDAIVATLAGLAAAFLSYKLITNWGKAVSGIKKAMAALGAVFSGISLPALLVAAAIGLVVGALVYLWRTNEGFRKKVKAIWESIKKAVGDAVNAIVKFVKSLVDKIKKFWQQNGKMILKAAENIFDGIYAVIKFVMPAVLAIIKQVWKNIKGIINGALDIILGVIETFAALLTGNFSKMWDGVKKIFKGAFKFIWNLMNLQFIGKFLGGIKSFVKAGISKFKSFVSSAKSVFTDLSNGIKGIVNGVFNFLKSIAKNFYNSFIKPIVDWLNKNLKSAFDTVFNGVKSAINSAWNTIKSVGDSIKSALNGVIDWISNTFESGWSSVWDTVKSIFGGVYDKVKSVISSIKSALNGVVSWVSDTFKKGWSSAWSGVKSIVGGVYDKVKSVINSVKSALNGVVSWITGTFKKGWSTAWSGVKSIFGGVYDKVKSVISSIKSALNGVVSWVSKTFKKGWSAAWNGVKSVFSSIFNGMYKIVKKPLNWIIDGINFVIGGLNKISIKIPKWVPGIGGKKFGVNIPKIPHLAQGGYVGANNPMLAVVGDNKTEGEIIAPESKIYEQAFRAISDALAKSGGGSIDLTINLGSTRIYREIIKGINMVQRQAGKTLLNV